MNHNILIVDDEESITTFIQILLQKSGYKTFTAANGKEALEIYDKNQIDLVLTDLQMPTMDGMELLGQIKNRNPEAVVIMLTAHGTTESAVGAMKIGAYDYILKPAKNDEILLTIEKALETKVLRKENRSLRQSIQATYQFQNIIGNSQAMATVFDIVKRVAPTKSNILIMGESGTGKELVAKALHYSGPLKDKPFITVNCGAIPLTLMESEMFGHKKGSFTGASHDKEGLFHAAHTGTIFLDEVGDLPLEIQVKLLRVLQDRLIRPVGTLDDIPVDVRVVAATNRDLETMVKEGSFREDLYYRLNVIQIRTPSLRQRREDIPILAGYFLRKFTTQMKKNIASVSKDAMMKLTTYDYPGNVRELENSVERAVAVETSNTLQPTSLPSQFHENQNPFDKKRMDDVTIPDTGINLDEIVGNLEKVYIAKALEKGKGVKKRAATLLGITFRSMRYRLQKYGMDDGSEE